MENAVEMLYCWSGAQWGQSCCCTVDTALSVLVLLLLLPKHERQSDVKLRHKDLEYAYRLIQGLPFRWECQKCAHSTGWINTAIWWGRCTIFCMFLCGNGRTESTKYSFLTWSIAFCDTGNWIQCIAHFFVVGADLVGLELMDWRCMKNWVFGSHLGQGWIFTFWCFLLESLSEESVNCAVKQARCTFKELQQSKIDEVMLFFSSRFCQISRVRATSNTFVGGFPAAFSLALCSVSVNWM